MSLRPIAIVLAVASPFVIGAAMRGGADATPAAPRIDRPVPIVPTAAPRVHVPHADGGFPDLAPKPTPKPKPKPAPKPKPVPVRPTPTPSQPHLTPIPTPPPRVHVPPHHPCDPGPCTITNGGGED
jgi:hypothetical protein